MLSFENLKVWQRSMLLAKELVEIANSLPKNYQYSFSDQLRRSALSIPNNIAEGAGRRTKADMIQFYMIARGSTYESVNVIKLLELLKEKSLENKNLGKIYSDAEEIVKMLYGLSRQS